MSDPDPSFGAVFVRELGDPMRSFIASACEAWTVGLSALQPMLDRPGAAPTDAARAVGGDPVSALIALFTRFTGAMGEAVARQGEQGAGLGSVTATSWTSGDFGGSTDHSSAIAGALLVAMTSTLRYWRGLAAIYNKHQTTLMRATAGRLMTSSTTLEGDNRLLIEELRAFLREVGEAALQEARRLENELEQISETLADRTQQPDQAAYRRRWKAKD
jgi:hypothetical protein